MKSQSSNSWLHPHTWLVFQVKSKYCSHHYNHSYEIKRALNPKTNYSKDTACVFKTVCTSTNRLYAPHWGWPWCHICECSSSTRSSSDAPHPHLHFYVRLQSKNPTAGTRQREPSYPDPVKIEHTKHTVMSWRAENGGILLHLLQVSNPVSWKQA